MAPYRFLGVIVALIVMSSVTPALCVFSNWVRNDQYPLYSSVYPYDYLTRWQKANLRRFEYTYPVERFRLSISGFRQSARQARDNQRNVINIGDINGRWNMLGLFYDPASRARFTDIVNVDDIKVNDPCNPTEECDRQLCFDQVTRPELSDPNKEFGFFTIPALYRKYGVRFESEILLLERCFYAIGLRMQFGVADVRQTILDFGDLTCQALGIACPATIPGNLTCTTPGQMSCATNTTCPAPQPANPIGITPPFTDPNNPSLACSCFPAEQFQRDCVPLVQRFRPCCNSTCCFSYDCNCKRFVIENIMKQKQLIADRLCLDICNYHKIGFEDLRISAFWRQIFVINEESDIYPRLLIMPFIEAGVGVPMDKRISTFKPFAVPTGNNGHASVSVLAGFTLDFLDTLDLSFAGGFSHFFKQDYCNYPLPTNKFESGIYPYTADVKLRPGTTWNANIGMHAWHFLPNLSVWAEYQIISHAEDDIEVCRSFIPDDSIYSPNNLATRGKGFLVDLAECRSKWESHMFTVGFNYDLSDHLSAGLLWQIPVKQRNVYRSNTVLGTLTVRF